MIVKHLLAILALALTLSPATATHAQSAQSAEPAPASAETPAKRPSFAAELQDFEARSRIQTFYLTNVSQVKDADEILVALRNMLQPYDKIYLVASQNAIVIDATPEQLALSQRIIHDLDRPRKTYRLTYTITDLDNGQRVGTEHYSMIVTTGQRTVLKQGDKVPVATGTYGPGSTPTNGVQTQFTYIDIGMNFDATLDESVNGVGLQSKVSQSSLGQPSTIAGIQEPVVRQVDLEGASFLSPGKPIILGTLDIPGTTRSMEISVLMEQVP